MATADSSPKWAATSSLAWMTSTASRGTAPSSFRNARIGPSVSVFRLCLPLAGNATPARRVSGARGTMSWGSVWL
jgi:hypothetical protein